jgi:Flp pilus assembly protein TadG
MKQPLKTKRNDRRRGNALLEAGLMAPVLFLLLSGVVDLGRAFYFADISANAARAGAQFGILSAANAWNTAGIEAAARAEAPELPNAVMAVVVTPYCQNSGGGYVTCSTTPNAEEYVQVNATISYNLVIPWPGLTNPLSITGSSVMRVQ